NVTVSSFSFGRVMVVFPSLVVFGFSTKPPTMTRLFAELSGHYLAGVHRRLSIGQSLARWWRQRDGFRRAKGSNLTAGPPGGGSCNYSTKT
ncbi:MAG: hypothetical protein KA788_03660, partial [Lacunisphaera sp.]|nr:hypothetical protein [Lacunisphaera sp.]